MVFQNYEKLNSYCYITFDSGELSYDCKSLDEFKQYAFGKEIKLKAMSIGVSENWVNSLISVHAIKQIEAAEQEYILSSTDEKLLVDLRDALRTKKKGISLNSTHTIINCEKHEDNSIHIGDSNQISNSIISSKNKAEIEQEIAVSGSEGESLASKSFWQIVVPVVVGVIVVAICVATGLN